MRCKILCVTTGQLRCKCASDEVELFVRDHLSHGGDPLLDSLDLFRPRAACVVGIGNAGGIFAFGLGEVFKKVIEFLLECRAAQADTVRRARPSSMRALVRHRPARRRGEQS